MKAMRKDDVIFALLNAKSTLEKVSDPLEDIPLIRLTNGVNAVLMTMVVITGLLLLILNERGRLYVLDAAIKEDGGSET